MKWRFFYLFLSGFFFDGTVDHVIFTIRKTDAPYGVSLGLTGNLLMALFDLLIASVFFFAFKRKIRNK